MTDTELTALFDAWQMAEKAEQRAYDELCDAEDDYEQSLNEVDGAIMSGLADRWRTATSQTYSARRAYHQAMYSERWAGIRAAIADKKQNQGLGGK